ncbi:MAG TPA: NosD domain-containing protein, partial [Candidatus Baltobacteraceae bacterium]|nr:NosD domain-containing protein [Candidatus Baltobacteraceae bacterium]
MIVTVCAVGCAYDSLGAAVQRVPVRSTIVVRGNARGGVTVDRPLTIRGEGGAAISGGDSGIVVRAPHVVVEHLRFTGYAHDDPSGRSAAVVLAAPDGTVRENVFEANGFAITASRADRARIESNAIHGGDDAIRLWYTPDAVIARNGVTAGRDVLVSYSRGVTFADNRVRGNRYGLHDMFSDGMRVLGNTFENNEIGANFMYAAHLEVRGNTFRANHGAAGYGIGFEDVDASRVHGNRFVQNRVAMNGVDSPADPRSPDAVDANVFAQNGTALGLQSDPHAIRVAANAFIDNLEDVEVSGGGSTTGIVWRGNYWSAYAGYDRDGDGIGDIPYAPQPAFDALTDTHPELQMFRYSPAALAVQFAA